jgi:hypothetical protein
MSRTIEVDGRQVEFEIVDNEVVFGRDQLLRDLKADDRVAFSDAELDAMPLATLEALALSLGDYDAVGVGDCGIPTPQRVLTAGIRTSEDVRVNADGAGDDIPPSPSVMLRRSNATVRTETVSVPGFAGRPIPKPTLGEGRPEFMQRCQADPTLQAMYGTGAQIAGVCSILFNGGPDMRGDA